MVVIDWLQTSEFIRANSERFILYSLCGCFIGIAFIFLTIIIILFLEKRKRASKEPPKLKSNYQVPRMDDGYNDILPATRPYPSAYHYNEHNQNGIYHM